MRYQVPQFIGVEDKIFGPFSFKQFIYIAGGGGIIALLFLFLPIFVAIVLAVPVGVFSGALAFYKINNRPFIVMVEAAFRHLFKTKLYVWQKEENVGPFSESSMTPPSHNNGGGLKEKTLSIGVTEEGAEEEAQREAEKADMG